MVISYSKTQCHLVNILLQGGGHKNVCN